MCQRRTFKMRCTEAIKIRWRGGRILEQLELDSTIRTQLIVINVIYAVLGGVAHKLFLVFPWYKP